MFKEHKKLYKAGKNWLVATLTVASFSLLSTMIVPSAKADTLDSETVNNSSVQLADQSNNNQKNIQNSEVAQESENTLAVSNNNDTESYNDPMEYNTSQYKQSEVKDDNANNLSIQGTVNVKDWKYKAEKGILTLTNYDGRINKISLFLI